VYFAESDGSPSGEMASKPNLSKARGEIRERKYTGRVWCFNMPSGFIWVRRVAKDEHGVVTKASRPLITGNCLTTEFQQRSTVLGTADFMAPEIIERKPYGVKVDVWAIGMFVIELAHRTTPFHGMPPKAVLDRLQAFGPPKLPTSKGKKWSNDMRAFVATCLVMDPEKRPSSASLERNPC
jgi:serine/threonine protein kinase